MQNLQTELSKVTREEIEAQTLALKKRIKGLEILKPEDATEAKEIEKECKALENLIEEKRTELTVPLNETLGKINALAKDLVKPITQAKEDIRAKQIEYAQKLEAERQKKEQEILSIIQKVNSAPDEIELELYADQVQNPDGRIKVAIEARRNYFEEQERMRKQKEEMAKEQARLDAIAKEQGEEAARLAQSQAEERIRIQKAEDEKKRMAEDARLREAEEMAEYDRQQAEKKQEAGKVKGLRKVVKFEVVDGMKVPRNLCSPDDTLIRAALKEGVREIPGVRIWAEDKIQ